MTKKISIQMLFFILFTIAASFSDVSCGNAYCSNCDDNKQCTSCIFDYILVNGECKFMRDEHCNDVSWSNSSICLECLEGYKIDPKTQKCVEGRETCFDYRYEKESYQSEYYNFTCKKYICEENEVLVGDKCIDFKLNPYCEEFEENSIDASKCKVCKIGTENIDGKCMIVDNFCGEFLLNENDQITNKCVKCVYGYVLGKDGKCVKGDIEDCVIYQADQKCRNCKNLGAVINNKCTDVCNVDNCVSCYAGSPDICLICEEGYAQNELSQCFKLPENCLEANWNNGYISCRTCESGYYKTLDYVKNINVCQKNMDNCEVQNGKNNCKKCNAGYYVDENGKCEKFHNHCLYGTEDKCNTCEEGYSLEQGGYCWKRPDNCKYVDVIDKYCSECNEGYYLDSTTKTCVKCSSECSSCSKTEQDYCWSCTDPSKIAYKGKCYTEIEGCNSYDTITMKCLNCQQGYVKAYGGLCETDGCAFRSNVDTTKCDSCVNGYYMTKDYKCKKCNPKCVNGCVHSSDICLNYKIDNCLQYTAELKCSKCDENYVLRNGICEIEQESEENQEFECLDEAVNGQCVLCYNNKNFMFEYPNEHGECSKTSRNYAFSSNLLFFALILIMLI